MNKNIYLFYALLLLVVAATVLSCSSKDEPDIIGREGLCFPKGDYLVKILSKESSESGAVKVIVVEAPEEATSHFDWPYVEDYILISDYNLQIFHDYTIGETFTIHITQCYYFGNPPHKTLQGHYYTDVEHIVIKNQKS